MFHEYVLRSKSPAASLAFAMDTKGTLRFSDEPPAPVRVLRRETNGLITVLWGEQIISGVVRSGGERGDALELIANGKSYTLALREAAVDEMEQRIGKSAQNGGALEITSPIPGLVKAVLVKQNEKVTSGQTLIVLEAMKMENEIAAPHDGTVAVIHVAPGQAVAAGASLAALKLSD